QADCKVKEYEIKDTPKKVLQQKKDAAGQPMVTADNKAVMEEVEKPHVVEAFKRDITERCPEPSLLHGEGGEGEGGEGGAAAHHAEKFPCWRPAYQPAVCKKDV